MMGEDAWFVVRRARQDLWMIVEPGHVVSWLYEGSARALLVDSGTGILPIAPLVGQLTEKPVTLVNTHYHFDHIGGNAGFGTRLAGEKAAPFLARPASADLLARYLAGLPAEIAASQARSAEDADAFARTPELELRPLPANFRAESWRPGGLPATALLREGEEIDLGDRRLRVIETPGHSPDGICLFDAEAGLLFAGDTLTEGALYAHYDESSLADLAASARRLSELPLRTICAGHVARAIAEVSIVEETVEAIEAVQAGAPYRLVSDIFGYPVRQTRGERVWIYHAHGRESSFALHD